jgi:hypothetical protein
MSKQEDETRMRDIEGDFVALAVFNAIERLPHAQRLYPDLYALAVAQSVREAIEAHQEPENRVCPTCKREPGELCLRVTDNQPMVGFHAMRFSLYDTAVVQKVLG